LSFVPLTQAVTSGDAGAVKALLADGADVNERTGGGQTPLILATIFGHTHLIPLLLDAGADPQLRDNLGLNAVDWAQRRGATEAIDVLSNKSVRTSGITTTARTQAPPPNPPEPSVEKSSTVSEEERSRRWIAGLKQRIAEQSQRVAEQPQRTAEQSQSEVPEGRNIFRPHVPFPLESLPLFTSSEREPQPEIPAEPSAPQPELPATPEPQPEIPSPPPDPQHELPAEPQQPEPESPAEPTQPEVETVAPRAEAVTPQVEAAAPASPRRSTRKRCPKCNAIYNSELVAYCAHHIVALVDDDESAAPIISQPQTTSPVMFWMIIIITLTGSLMVGSVVAAFFYSSKQVQPAAATTTAPQTPPSVQKGTPALGKELEGKVVSLPIAECPLNGQEAIPGTVVVRVTVSQTGQVTDAKASGGDWLLRGAATEAAKKSTFAPEKLRGRTTEGTITYTFEP
jgi:TonB family protein